MPDPPVSPPQPQPAPPPPPAPTAISNPPPRNISPHAPLPPMASSSKPTAPPTPNPSPTPQPTASTLPVPPPTTTATNLPQSATASTSQPAVSPPATAPPDSPSSAQRRTKGGRRAANPHLTEEERRRERVLKNRESAMKSLQKKKRYTEDLEHRAVALARRNAELKEKIRVLLVRLNAMSVTPGPVPVQPMQNTATTPPFLGGEPSFQGRVQQQPIFPQQGQSASFQPQLPCQTNKNNAMGQTVLKTEPSVISNALPPQMGSASSSAGASSSFPPLDDWVQTLPEAFLSPTASALPPSAITGGPQESFSGGQQGGGNGEVGESFLGMGLGLGVGGVNSQGLVQQGMGEGQFGMTSQESSDKIGASFDLQHMACSQ